MDNESEKKKMPPAERTMAAGSAVADPVEERKSVGKVENQVVRWSRNDLAGAGLGTAAELPFV